MKILYNTDLHGSKWKYERSLEIAKKESVDIVINGGDLLPTGGDLIYDQEVFLSWDLREIFEQFNDLKIHYLFIPGNNDLKIFDRTFNQMCTTLDYVRNLAMKCENILGFNFIGFNLIHDYPFTLKDRCRMDNREYEFPEQYSTQILSNGYGFHEFESVEKWEEHCRSLPSLEEELNQLVKPDDFQKTIYVMHEPPYGTGLDQLQNSKYVGSKSILEFIKLNQPLMTLHGHTHKSKNNQVILGKTVCIQPGQSKDFYYAIIDLSSMKVQFFCETEEGIKS